jgi:hypothetical protein
MSVNKHRPHVFVLPEDSANRQLANGFHLGLSFPTRQMQVLPPAGGWTKVLDTFVSEHISEMDRCPDRYMVLLIDFDGREQRLPDAKDYVPERLADRVFILGALTKPEALKADLGTYETIGSALAQDCRQETNTTWGHRLLQHNAPELDRLRARVRPILFPAF